MSLIKKKSKDPPLKLPVGCVCVCGERKILFLLNEEMYFAIF